MEIFSENNDLRVLVLHNTLSPYRVPLFQALSKSRGYQFKFLFSSRQIDEHKWQFGQDLGFNYDILPTKQMRTKQGTLYFLKDMRMLAKQCDLVVLSDHLNIPELALQSYASLKRLPKLRWLELTKGSLADMPKVKIILKALLNRISDGILVPGTAAKEYVLGTTHREDNIYFCNNVVRNESFAKARAVPQEQKNALKKKFRLTGPVIAYFGQFIERKGLRTLMEALELVDRKYQFSLLLVGEGQLKEELLNKLTKMKRCLFYFAGYIDPSDLSLYYALSDLTVLPSHLDIWGMVVNESIAAGVPVICSTGVGAARDLIQPGKSGLIFEKGNVRELASALEKMLSSKGFRESMVRVADKMLENYTIEKARDQFLDAIDRTYAYAGRFKNELSDS